MKPEKSYTPDPELIGHCPACKGQMLCPCPACAVKNAGKTTFIEVEGDGIKCPHCGLTRHIDFWEDWDMECYQAGQKEAEPAPVQDWVTEEAFRDVEEAIKNMPEEELQKYIDMASAPRSCEPGTCHGQCQGMGSCEDARSFREEYMGLPGGKLPSLSELAEDLMKG